MAEGESSVAELPAPASEDAPQVAAKAEKAAKGEKAKGAKGEKGKKAGKAAKGELLEATGPSVAAHPRAARAVARAKASAGLLGFGLGAYFSLPTGTLAEALARALGAGIVSYIAVWAGAVFVWRRLVILELKGREQQLLGAARARQPPRELPAPAPARAPQARAGGAS